MNLSIFSQPAAHDSLTMSSREIAELTGKEHGHVIRDIRVMIEALDDDQILDHVREDKDARGYTTAFHLDRDLTLTLVSGYNVKVRLAIVRRWQELEAKQHAPQALTPIEQDLRIVSILADMLNVAPSGKITMARVVLTQSAPHLLPVLPGYAVDAPASGVAVSGSSEATLSATELLKRHQVNL